MPYPVFPLNHNRGRSFNFVRFFSDVIEGDLYPWTEQKKGEIVLKTVVLLGLYVTSAFAAPHFVQHPHPYARPNPFRPRERKQVVISIPTGDYGTRPQVMIYAADGSFVRQLKAVDKKGKRLVTEWDARNDEGLAVASGVYFVLVTAHESGKESGAGAGDSSFVFPLAVYR